MTISAQNDVRVTIISRIWACATVMFLISVLPTYQGQDRRTLFLPATIVLGAATSTIVVLRKVRYPQQDTLFPSEPLKEFKQRLENLEAIATSDASHWEPSSRQLDQSTLDRS